MLLNTRTSKSGRNEISKKLKKRKNNKALLAVFTIA